MATTFQGKPSKARKSRRSFAPHKPSGVLSSRVPAVGPEHFGIVSVDSAKLRSKLTVCDFYGKVLLAPIELDHTKGGLTLAVARSPGENIANRGLRRRNRQRTRRDALCAPDSYSWDRKCLHHYFYYQHPVVGFRHARLQTWFPFTMHICLNGREWLARQMDAESMGYLRRDNCFVQVANLERAQQLLDQQLRLSRTSLLKRIAQQAHPAQKTIFGRHSLDLDYYWSAEESEWASDILFRSPEDLSAPLNPFSLDDAKLLQAVNRGEFLLNGFRNRDLRPLLYSSAEASPEEAGRQASSVTRKLRLLRAHGLIRKVSKTHRYLLTDRGQSAISALLAARQADTAKLAQLAA